MLSSLSILRVPSHSNGLRRWDLRRRSETAGHRHRWACEKLKFGEYPEILRRNSPDLTLALIVEAGGTRIGMPGRRCRLRETRLQQVRDGGLCREQKLRFWAYRPAASVSTIRDSPFLRGYETDYASAALMARFDRPSGKKLSSFFMSLPKNR